MPLYDYRCHSCGKVFEVRQKFADEVLKTHEDCGGELERLISAPALQFKGTGWYVTDYAGKSPASEPGKDDKSSSDKKDSKDSSKDSKDSSTKDSSSKDSSTKESKKEKPAKK